MWGSSKQIIGILSLTGAAVLLTAVAAKFWTTGKASVPSSGTTPKKITSASEYEGRTSLELEPGEQGTLDMPLGDTGNKRAQSGRKTGIATSRVFPEIASRLNRAYVRGSDSVSGISYKEEASAKQPGGEGTRFFGDLRTSLGTKLQPEEPATSVAFEPLLGLDFAKRGELSLYALIDRPLDPYKNFAVPKVRLEFDKPLSLIPIFNSELQFYLTALQLERWSIDGYMTRGTVGLKVFKEFFSALTLAGKVAPFVQANQYRQTESGRDLSRGGFNEELDLTLRLGAFTLDLAFLVTQSATDAVWRNDYASYEYLSYGLNKFVSVGVGHELLSSVIDSSTGFFRPIQLFDGRESRVLAFLEVAF